MATTIEQQVVLDKALIPGTKRLRIGRSNFRLPSDIQSKESTLQVVYDVLRQSPFFKAFLVTADHIVDLEAFREMLHISPRVSGQSFTELPFEDEILEFLRNTKAYKEYYACATREAAPKPKASARKKRDGSASSTTPPTPIATPTPTTTVVATSWLSAAAKGKQSARATSPTDPSDVERTEAEQLKIKEKRWFYFIHHSSNSYCYSNTTTTVVAAPRLSAAAKGGSSIDEGTGSILWVSDLPSDDSEEEISWNFSDDEDVDDQTKGSDDKEAAGSRLVRSIATCSYPIDICQDIMKAQEHISKDFRYSDTTRLL
nr:hypothetical protein [Tanacetum cinerariifolium]